MIYFYLVRHGETIFNTYHRMQGWCDTPLTDKGRQQAMDVAKGLKDIPYIHVYSSDSGRAMETATYIAKRKNLKPCPIKGFREMFFGTMEGLDTDIGHYRDRAYRDTYGWIDVGGEDMAMLKKRMFASLHQILPQRDHNDAHIVIVSHGIAIMAVVQEVNVQLFHKQKDYGGVLQNASVTTITYDKGVFQLQDFNNTSYRDKGGSKRNEKNYQ